MDAACPMGQTDLSMMIERNPGVVGALNGADSNSRSFPNPEWQRRRRQQQSDPDGHTADEHLALIDSQPSYRLLEEAAHANLGAAISFNQTQDAFLQRVQASLERMNELSVLATDGARSDGERLVFTNEFNELQRQIQDLSAKMIEAADLFYRSPDLEAAADGVPARDHALDQEERRLVDHCLQPTCDPARTTLTSASNASVAQAAIHHALEKVSSLRSQLDETIKRLNVSFQTSSTATGAATQLGISGLDVAEASTRDLRYEILVESGTAMLAQANALPESALRLLR